MIDDEITADDIEISEYPDEAIDVDAQDKRVKSEKQDVPVETIDTWVKRGRMDLQPDFQRLFVWNKAKCSRLIESVLLEIPIPVVYAAETIERKLEIVDGQQRLTSLCSFVDGKMPDGAAFRLSGLRVLSELNGKAFSDLDQDMQESILSYTLRLIVISRDSNPDVKFEVFERLNSGSVKLNNQELRNCIYRGKLNETIKKLSKNSFLRKIRRVDSPHSRMEDVHLVLRFLTIRDRSHINYKPPMKQFLNRFMASNQNAPDELLNAWAKLFEDAIEAAWHIWGEKSFRRFEPATDNEKSLRWSNPINVALWDTLLYGLSYYPKPMLISKADSIREEFVQIMSEDATFRDFTSAQTDNIERFTYRADMWKERLKELLGTPWAAEPRSFSRKLKETMYASDPTCAICQQHIQDMDDAEIDHIEHYWRGGKTIPENAQLAHRFCNRSKGGR